MARNGDVGLIERTQPFAMRSLIARMRNWFAASGPACRDSVAAPERCEACSSKPVRSVDMPARLGLDFDATINSTVVRLPLNGRQLLNQLANDLRSSFAQSGAVDDDPVSLALTAASQQLWIDSTSFVEVGVSSLPYRVVLGDVLRTRITLETADFAEVRKFVGEYLSLTRGPLPAFGGNE